MGSYLAYKLTAYRDCIYTGTGSSASEAARLEVAHFEAYSTSCLTWRGFTSSPGTFSCIRQVQCGDGMISL
jgi:hypothetical protein